MGWRVSFYKADRERPIIVNEPDDDGNGKQINGEELLNNEGTVIWTEEITEEQKNNPELFSKLIDDEDCDYYNVTKSGLELFIQKYREHIINMYEGFLKEDEASRFSLQRYAKRKHFMWSHGLVLNMWKNYDHIGVTTSDLWEYTIFNLIYLYRNFDFENYKLVLYGG